MREYRVVDLRRDRNGRLFAVAGDETFPIEGDSERFPRLENPKPPIVFHLMRENVEVDEIEDDRRALAAAVDAHGALNAIEVEFGSRGRWAANELDAVMKLAEAKGLIVRLRVPR